MSMPAPEFPSLPANTPTLSFGGYATEAVGLPGVTFWPRVLARLIDYVLHYCVSYAAGILFAFLVLAATGGHMPPWVLVRFRHAGLIGFASGLIGFVLYNVICVAFHGSTLGKRLLSMVVVQENGTRCRFMPAVIREFGYFIDSLFFGLIGYLAMQKTYQEQRYGDQWAGTVVCKRSDVIPEQLRSDGSFILFLMLAVMADAATGMIGLLLLLSR
ncbi:MAG: RDD family protein [Candidatus Sulfotelmatobacter sp.]